MTAKKPQMLDVGQTYQGFTVTKAIEIPELQCTLQELTHDATGALVIHLGNEDPENLFCLSLRTTPTNSNGVAHILEHTVLCGSEKYPVKDPFFSMGRRSLNTFMNAMTGADFTCYPAASQVPKDFYNLLEVYIDAVFKPKLNELSFLQEGHRLEFSKPTDPSSPLEYKGIVFNEMKGALSSPTTRLIEVINESLYPNLTYGHNSGGDPKVIPSLSYEELKEFHKEYYHPSRCLFFFYGNFPLKDHLDFIAKYALNNVEKLPTLPQIPLQPRFTKPVYRDCTYPISAEEDETDKTIISLAWLTCHILNQQELLALNVLDIYLMNTDASPLKLALLKSGLCKQASSYIDDDVSEVPFFIILKGCNPGTEEQIEALIRQTLKQIAMKGISLDDIESSLHQVEFYRSEITGDSSPFGLSLFMRSALLKQHGGQPEDGLVIHSLFKQLHEKMSDPQYLASLITRYLIDNPHYVRVVMKPDKTLAKKEMDEEKAALDKVRETLTKEQEISIIQKAQELAKLQEEEDDDKEDVLPKVTLDDVPKKARDYPLIQEKIGNFDVFFRNCFTNEIIYADMIFQPPNLPVEDLPYVRLLTVLFSQMGCASRDYKANLDYQQANLGAFGASLSLNLQAHDHAQFSPSFHIRGKALFRKTDKLFNLFYDMATSIDFTDIPRLKEVILKHYTGLESGLNQNALKYAINKSASGLSVAATVTYDWYGLEYYWTIKKLAQNFDKHAKSLVSKLKSLQNQLLCLEGAHLVLTCDERIYSQLKKNGFYGLMNMPAKPYSPWLGHYPIKTQPNQGCIIASPVAFTGKVFQTVPYVHPASPALNISAFIFDNLSLHTKIREQGGAYGGGSANNAMSGNFYFYSYRDPNIVSTLAAFEEAIKEVSDGKFDEEDLEEAKLEMIQSLDSPVAPGSQGEIAYSWLREGRPLAIRQAFRDKLLDLDREDIIKAVKTYIAPNYNEGATVIFAGQELLEKENKVLKSKDKEPLEIINI